MSKLSYYKKRIDHVDGWITGEDPESGDIYYINIFTKETTWDKPEAMVELE